MCEKNKQTNKQTKENRREDGNLLHRARCGQERKTVTSNIGLVSAERADIKQ